MVVMETMFGVTDVFLADQDMANRKGATWIWKKRRQKDSWAKQRLRPQYKTLPVGTVGEHIH